MKMASFAAKIGFKISSHLQCRLYSIPCKNRTIGKNQVICLKSRDHSSSAPVRYTSKTSSKVKLSETSPQVKNLEKSKYFSRADVGEFEFNGEESERGKFSQCEASQIQNEMQNNLLLGDMGQGFEQMEEIEEVSEELTIHQKSQSRKQDLLQINKCTVVEESAIKLLAMRALTTVELRKKLLGKRFSSDAVEAVINKFLSKGLINDKLYAESFSRSRWSSSTWGPRRIKQALSKKGVSQADAEKAVELVFNEEDRDEDQKSIIGLSKHSIDHLYDQASKQWNRSHDVPKETRKSRVIRWLQYRGFDWGVTNFILKKLEKEAPP